MSAPIPEELGAELEPMLRAPGTLPQWPRDELMAENELAKGGWTSWL